MAIAFGSAATAVTASATSLTISVPASTVNGNLLLMAVANSLPDTYTTPTGWTALDANSSSGDVECATFWRVASSEPASYTVSMSGTTAFAQAGAILRYTGQLAGTPIRAHTQVAGLSAGTTSPTPGSMSGSMLSGDFGVIFYGWGDNASDSTNPTFTAPVGWNNRVSIGSGGAFTCGLLVVDLLNGTATPTASTTTPGGWVVPSVAIALNAAAGAKGAQFMPFFT